MTSYVFIDTVLQVFAAEGNLHVIGGVSNGEVDQSGKDVLEKSLHLTIPMQKALKIIPEIAASLPVVLETNLVKDSSPPLTKKEGEIEGEGLHFKL
jgi:hypothetical protein